jgi:putative NIF3 family GTP cyclohydrolase 1 type 2
LIDRLRDADKKIDLAISHHPTGRALASLYDVMDLQVDVFHKEGVSLSAAQNLLAARKAEIQRRLNPINHQKIVDIAKWLKINLLCMHTPCDNLAYQYIRKLMDKERPATVARVMEILNEVPEYKQAAGENNPVMIEIGTKSSRVNHIHVDFTGGTEGPDGIYEKLSNCAVDTIIAMHQSEEHFKKCKEHNLNVIVASHIASDNLGVNLMLDHLGTKADFKVYEVGGFRRFPRKK